MQECTDAEVQRMLPLVSAQRREQALRYKHTFGRFCCLKSWLMLKEELENEGIKELGDFQYNEHGKPFLSQQPIANSQQLFFSLSHCKEGIAVVVDDRPIGIDIESIRRADKDLIVRTMNEEEQVQIAEVAEPDRAFTRLWTQKEAVVKAQGTGIESFEQLRNIRVQNTEYRVQTFETEKYIYSIAYGELFGFRP